MSSLFKKISPESATHVPEPPIARFLFADTRMAWFWLIVRLYVAYEWFTAGWEKLTGTNIDFTSATFGQKSGAWVFNGLPDHAQVMYFFATSAAKQSTGAHPAVQQWYANFLTTFVAPYPVFWSYVITFGELAVGLGLAVGCLTGIAAFFGLVMNFNYLLAGAVSTNPILGFLALMLILAWRIAGYYGVDRYLLPLLGTPWTGSLAKEKATTPPVNQAVTA